MPSMTKSIVLLLLLAGASQGFSLTSLKPPCPSRTSSSSTTSTQLAAVSGRNVAASLMLATGFLWSDSALALPTDTMEALPSSTLIAARSGGRAGGRAYRAPPAARREAPAPTTYRSTTIVRPMLAAPSVVVSPFGGGYGYGGYGYTSPMSGFGLGYGLGAINSAGDSMREYRQESEIQRERAELDLEKQKSADLEARIRQLEAAQTGAAK